MTRVGWEEKAMPPPLISQDAMIRALSTPRAPQARSVMGGSAPLLLPPLLRVHLHSVLPFASLALGGACSATGCF